MASRNNIYVMCKVTPVFPSGAKSEEYIVSEDFFYPLTYFSNESNCSQDSDSDFDKDSADEVDVIEEFLRESDCPIEAICPCIENLAFMKFTNRVSIKMDPIMLSLILQEMKRSKTFRKNSLSRFFMKRIHERKMILDKRMCKMCFRHTMKIHTIVILDYPKKNVFDSKWCKKIQILVNERCELENAMAWLSTLGGAFSALGDKYIECAEKAGAISMQQLYIALRIGDPLTICRCKIYFAMSLLQRGYYKKTKLLIKELYKFSTEGEGSKDFRLKNMCLSVWNRFRYMLLQKRLKKIKDGLQVIDR